MMDLKNLVSAIAEIAEQKGIPQDSIAAIVSEALASAYKKEYGKKRQKIKANIDLKTGQLEFWLVKQVVDDALVLSERERETIKKEKEDAKQAAPSAEAEKATEVGAEEKIRFNPERHILLSQAKTIKPDAQHGEEISIALETKSDFSRIAAQTAKQVILQKIKELEKEEIFKEFNEKEGEVVSGIIQRIEPNAIILNIGRTSGVLPKKEQISTEQYKIGQRLKVYVLQTENTPKGPVIILSRIHPKLICKLFELEVPEIGAKQVVIKAIAREAGSRSKIAVQGLEEGIDPIGSMVGQRGTRIMAVINELGGEKIDVVLWDDNQEKFIANALSPAKVLEVKMMPKNKAQAIIPDDQISLAIGKDGQNVRLAAKLTGWKIDIFSVSQLQQQKEDLLQLKPLNEEQNKQEQDQQDNKQDDKDEQKEQKQQNLQDLSEPQNNQQNSNLTQNNNAENHIENNAEKEK